MPSESDKWGWEHVSVFGGFDRGSGTKRWKCNHCNLRYNGSYSRVRAHLLGFSGVGVKSCPAVDRSLREAFQILEEERLARKKKRITGNGKITKRIHSSQSIVATKPIPKEDVDETIARFFYADGLNVNVLNSTYFNEMVKAIASVGPGYELPSMNKLSDCFLSKEKGKLEKFLGSIKESWSQTGCTIICVSRLGGTPGCSEMGIFVSSPRGLVFLKMLDIDDSDKAGNLISSGLSDIILEIGPNNVLQIISNLGHACKSSEPLLLSKFPHIFWSPCTSHSIRMLMEEIAGLDWVKSIISGAKDMEQQMMYYQRACSAVFPHNSFRESSDLISAKFASSYSLVRNILELKQSLREVVVSEEFKQWKLNVNMQEVIVMVESAILGDDFWGKAHFFVQLCEPFVKSLATFDIEKSAMGTVYDWRIQSLEAVRSQGIDATAISHLETLVENKWDGLFSPLHAAGFILNPRYFGKGQNKDKTLMRGWKATLEKYECDGSVRRILREQLSSYWHSEGAFGEEDAVDFRDKMEPVAWWENFGFETPQLQTLAIKVLSQLSSVGECEEIWRNSDFPFREAGNKLGVDRVEDLVFVRSNLRLSGYKNGNLISHPPSGIKTWDASQLDHTVPLANIHDKL